MKTYLDNNVYLNSVYFLNKFTMYEEQETTASGSTELKKTSEEILQECLQGISVRMPHLLIRYVHIAMQAYADQQANKVLDDAIQRVNNLKSLENFDLAEALYDQCLNMLISLKIKQP